MHLRLCDADNMIRLLLHAHSGDGQAGASGTACSGPSGSSWTGRQLRPPSCRARCSLLALVAKLCATKERGRHDTGSNQGCGSPMLGADTAPAVQGQDGWKQQRESERGVTPLCVHRSQCHPRRKRLFHRVPSWGRGEDPTCATSQGCEDHASAGQTRHVGLGSENGSNQMKLFLGRYSVATQRTEGSNRETQPQQAVHATRSTLCLTCFTLAKPNCIL